MLSSRKIAYSAFLLGSVLLSSLDFNSAFFADGVSAASADPSKNEEGAALKVGTFSWSKAQLKSWLDARLGQATPTQKLLEESLIRDTLLAENAHGLSAANQQDKKKLALAEAMEAELYREALKAVSSDSIKAYYEAHREIFQQESGIRIWRIRVKTKEEAEMILREGAGAKGREKWRNFSRDMNLDDATKWRDGDLGFVFPDGNTQIPQVRTESYLYEAALKLKDGELASEPIPDGNYFAAIWRRGTLPAKTESVEELSPMIREILADQAAKEALSRMIVTLRKMAKVESFPELLDSVESAVVDWPQAPGASQAAP